MQIVLNIIYFLLALTVLVSIHEAGHLSMAKLFNVYCDEYSIGFGPKIVQIQPKGVKKNGQPRETKFSIRCVPLGGFVSMAGEGMEDMEELSKLPKERFLTGVAKWKRAIIMVAGVVLNAVLGLILLITAYSTIPVVDYTKTSFSVTEKIEFKDIDGNEYKYTSPLLDGSDGVVIDSNTDISKIEIKYNGNIAKIVNEQEVIVKGDDLNHVYTITAGTKDLSTPGGAAAFLLEEGNNYYPKDDSATKTYVFYTVDGRTKEVVRSPYASSKNTETGEIGYSWQLIGISSHGRGRTFGEVMNHSFSTFGEYSIEIYKALGQLFTKDGFNQMGGPIAIVQQQMLFSSQGFGQFLLFWGLISINLAVINLLPFPGLDGWHFLVVIVEGITRKEINPKVKAIMSTIGMILLFGLMIAITFKDIFKLIF